ncbi:NAD(P)/FAD-dependent oxidoreductase [Pseudomonas xantholysinigenes]|uniref:FAD-binding oxidoreductase n=1 Tax=Pseudomonas xantholysinigenes TaxID=2745490 RepID=A0A9E6PSG9_9PSED|nr:FAD-binding oxidoreductase [Pseudomonas xantholysinigenes]QXI36421.1 FAD-binding oxidoreductase [Pseudomonas xantholysinigenes]
MATDLVVLGAGIVGASVVAEARRRLPGLSIVLLDDGRRVSASALSAGLVTPFCGEGLRRRRSLQAFAHYQALGLGWAGVSQLPFSYVHDPAQAPRPLLFEARSVASPLAEVLGRYRGQRTLGTLLQAGHALAVDVPGLVRACLALGATGPGRFERVEARVERVSREAAGWRLQAAGGTLQARHLIVAAGARGNALDGVVQGGSIKKIVAFDLQGPRPPDTAEGVIYLPGRKAFVMRNRQGDGWLLSITSEDWRNDAEGDLSVHSHETRQARRILDEELPGLDIHTLRPRAAFDSYCSDFEPQVVRLPQGPGACALVGASGSGVRFAPALACEALAAVGLIDSDSPSSPVNSREA